MIRSSKHNQVTPLSVKMTGGINLQSSAMAIKDNESPLLQNWMYQKGADRPTVRPGVTCETSTALNDEIVYLFHYTKDASNAWIMGVSDQNDVYYYNSATSQWVDTTVNVAQKPAMLTFNGKLLMADGSTTLKTWNGSSGGTQSIDGTIAPSVIAEVGNRVVINDTSAGGKDLVCFSAVEDETTWTFTSAGGAVSLRVGYKDGSSVVGLVKNFKNELLVFKQGERSESIYRVQTLGAPYDASANTAWVAEYVMGGQGISNGFCVESVDTAALILGRYGFGAIVADQMYSELNIQAIGTKVNPILGAAGNTNHELRFLASSGQVWIIRQDTSIYIYHPHNGAFTTYVFNNEQIYSVCETSDGIFFAGESGHLYTLDETAYRDEFSPSTYSDLIAIFKTKDWDMGPGKGLIKYGELLFEPVTQGSNTVYYKDNSRNKQATVDTHTETGGDLGDFMAATMDFMDADDYDFLGIDGLPWTQEIRKKFKGKRLQVQINTTGRCSIDSLSLQVAVLGG